MTETQTSTRGPMEQWAGKWLMESLEGRQMKLYSDLPLFARAREQDARMAELEQQRDELVVMLERMRHLAIASQAASSTYRPSHDDWKAAIQDTNAVLGRVKGGQ